MKQAYVVEKNQYGNTVYYPACELTNMITRLKGSKTITRTDIAILKENGYEVNLVQTGGFKL